MAEEANRPHPEVRKRDEQKAGGGELRFEQNEESMVKGWEQLLREVVYCQLHPEKEIEYFCKQCEESVCSRCIFKSHNGHLLVETSDIADALNESTGEQLAMHAEIKQMNA